MDNEYLIRRDRVRSEAAQAAAIAPQVFVEAVTEGSSAVAVATSLPAGLVAVIRELDELPDQGGAAHLLALQRCEAELCLYKPPSLLYPTYTRLKSKLYRIDDTDRREMWLADLKRMLPDNRTIVDEQILRQRLRQLSYEVNEEAASYDRLAKERSGTIRQLIVTGVILMAVLFLIALPLIMFPFGNDGTFLHWLPAACAAGAIGAAASSLLSSFKEKQRQDYISTLKWQMVSRALLGVVYALVVYSGVYSTIVPLAVPKDPEQQRALFLGLGFVAGFSDKLFGQTVSQFITKSSAPKKDAKSAGSSKAKDA